MHYSVSLHHTKDGRIRLTLFRGRMRYRQNLTPEQALQLSENLRQFAELPEGEPFYLLSESPS
jgi:hypothetical protein